MPKILSPREVEVEELKSLIQDHRSQGSTALLTEQSLSKRLAQLKDMTDEEYEEPEETTSDTDNRHHPQYGHDECKASVIAILDCFHNQKSPMLESVSAYIRGGIAKTNPTITDDVLNYNTYRAFGYPLHGIYGMFNSPEVTNHPVMKNIKEQHEDSYWQMTNAFTNDRVRVGHKLRGLIVAIGNLIYATQYLIGSKPFEDAATFLLNYKDSEITKLKEDNQKIHERLNAVEKTSDAALMGTRLTPAMVADLVNQGMTNKQIAEKAEVSVRTVANIRAKAKKEGLL